MSRVIEALKVLLLATWLLISLGLGLEAIQLRPEFEATLRDLHVAIVDVNKIAERADDATNQIALAATEQRAYWRKTSLETYKTMASVRLLITRVDHDVIPQVTQTVKDTDTAIVQSTADVSRLAGRAEPIFENLARVTGDPAIKQSVDNLATATGNAATATAEASASMAKIHEGVVYEVDSLMKPIGKVKAAALIVIRFVGRFFGF